MTTQVWQHGDEEAFWQAVERCLVEFFYFTDGAAHSRVGDFRVKLDQQKLNQPRIVYHDEPINLVSDLAGKVVELNAANAEKYSKILRTVVR